MIVRLFSYLLLILFKMLSHYFSKKTTLQKPIKEENSKNQEDIIESFYQQRRSRSMNVKQHNLLRKNISFFNKQAEDQLTVEAKQPEIKSRSYSNMTPFLKDPTKTIDSCHPLAKPPIRKSNVSLSNLQASKTSKSKQEPLEQSFHNISQISSNFSTFNVIKRDSQDEDYKKMVRNELSNRINIKKYLTQLTEENKQNETVGSLKNSTDKINSKIELKYNYDNKSLKKQHKSSLQQHQLSRISFTNSRDSRLINESRQSISSLLHQGSNTFQFSKNQKTDRIINLRRQSLESQNTFQHHRHSIPTLGDSGVRSHSSSRRTLKEQNQKNILMGEELSDLQQNSHPIRQMNEGSQSMPTTQKVNPTYIDPEIEAEYKRRIRDLQMEINEMKNQHKKQQKFIQSIAKMRKTIDNVDDDCSLKELWRWIKQLPQRK